MKGPMNIEAEIKDHTEATITTHEVDDLRHRLQRAEAESLEQARLLGMSAEREADLLGKLERAQIEIARLRAIFPRILEQLGSGACSKDASVDFLQYIPDEVGAVVRRLRSWAEKVTELNEKQAAEVARLRALVADLREWGCLLAGEWAWKRAAGTRNSDQMARLDEDLERARKALNE